MNLENPKLIKMLPRFNSKIRTEMEKVAAQAIDGTLPCSNRYPEADGDVRYWDVPATSNQMLSIFASLAREELSKALPAENPKVILMVNHVTAQDCPTGSGGGWHVDSVRRQFKLFCYLTDCLSEAQGPLCILTHRFRFLERMEILLNRIFTGGSRYKNFSIDRLEFLGFRRTPILTKAGVPFFVETSRIHCGLPICEGGRVMLTAYIFCGNIPESVQSRIGDVQAAL